MNGDSAKAYDGEDMQVFYHGKENDDRCIISESQWDESFDDFDGGDWEYFFSGPDQEH